MTAGENQAGKASERVQGKSNSIRLVIAVAGIATALIISGVYAGVLHWPASSKESLAAAVEKAYQANDMPELARAAKEYVDRVGPDERMTKLRNQALAEGTFRPVCDLLKGKKWEEARRRAQEVSPDSDLGPWGDLCGQVCRQLMVVMPFVDVHGPVLGPDALAPGARLMKSFQQLAEDAETAERDRWLPYEQLAEATEAARELSRLCNSNKEIVDQCGLLGNPNSFAQLRFPQLAAQLRAQQPTYEQLKEAERFREQQKHDEEVTLLEQIVQRWPGEPQFEALLKAARDRRDAKNAEATQSQQPGR